MKQPETPINLDQIHRQEQKLADQIKAINNIEEQNAQAAQLINLCSLFYEKLANYERTTKQELQITDNHLIILQFLSFYLTRLNISQASTTVELNNLRTNCKIYSSFAIAQKKPFFTVGFINSDEHIRLVAQEIDGQVSKITQIPQICQAFELLINCDLGIKIFSQLVAQNKSKQFFANLQQRITATEETSNSYFTYQLKLPFLYSYLLDIFYHCSIQPKIPTFKTSLTNLFEIAPKHLINQILSEISSYLLKECKEPRDFLQILIDQIKNNQQFQILHLEKFEITQDMALKILEKFSNEDLTLTLELQQKIFQKIFIFETVIETEPCFFKQLLEGTYKEILIKFLNQHKTQITKLDLKTKKQIIQITQNTPELTDFNQEINSQKKKKKKPESPIENQEKLPDSLLDIKERLESDSQDVRNVQQQLAEMQKEFAHIKTLSRQSQQNEAALTKQIKKLAEQKKHLEAKSKKQQVQLEESQNELKETQKQQHSVESKLDEKEKLCKKLQQQDSQNKAQIKQLESQLSTANSSLKNTQSKLQQQKILLLATNTKILDLERQTKTSQQIIKNLVDTQQEKEALQPQLNKELENLKAQLQESQSQNQQLQQEKEVLQSQTNKELEDLKAQLLTSQSQNQQLQQQQDSANQQLTYFEYQNISLRALNHNLNSALTSQQERQQQYSFAQAQQLYQNGIRAGLQVANSQNGAPDTASQIIALNPGNQDQRNTLLMLQSTINQKLRQCPPDSVEPLSTNQVQPAQNSHS